ncbi:MAG: D-alanyl-D-alanine carboxypeptidase/D-alanyl-D-alanine-endopeptidase [Chloroflexi bacterium]|nr:MAG: D-alanyl-D-alanine carboxypeptidase/D-alanyl-D-alanine-endopeptidase [Chloroflexota bacterium]
MLELDAWAGGDLAAEIVRIDLMYRVVMPRFVTAALMVVVVLLATSISQAAAQPRSASVDELAAQLDTLLTDPALEGVTVGVVVRSAESGEVLYDRGGDKHLPAASSQKLLTSAAALADLGPDYRFRTTVLVSSPPSGGVVAGDIYLRGTGDPTLVQDRFDELAAAVASHGVREVRGSVVADDTWFDSVRLGTDWSQQDENFAYAAPVSALSASPDSDFNVGSVQVDLAPGPSVGAPAQVGLTPPTSAVQLDNRLTTGPPGSARQLAADRLHGTDRILVAGNMPLDGRPAHPLRSVADPTGYAADLFHAALARHGVRIMGATRADATPAGAVELASLDSMPLGQLLFPFLKLSNNGIAEILVKAMGRRDANEGSWPAGLRVVQRYVATHGVDPAAIQLVDGSGLSTANLVAPDDLTAFLVAIQEEPWFDQWYAALPIAGVPDHLVGGTLAARMLDTAAAGNLHGKTGTLTTTSALVGYVTSTGGERLVFAIVQNGVVGPPTKDVEDAFAVTLASSDV